MPDLNYEQITRPYNYYLNRSSDVPQYNPNQSIPNLNSPGAQNTQTGLTGGYMNQDPGFMGNVETQPVKADGSLHDVWIDTFIASTNWKPKSIGFFIDGQSGYAEFTDVYISGEVHAGTGEIGGFLIGTDYIIDRANSFGLSSTITSGTDVRFWAGSSFAGKATAPFRVYEDGTAHIGGFDIGTTAFTSSSGNIKLDAANGLIIAGDFTGARVVLNGPGDSLEFYSSTNVLQGQMFGTTSPSVGVILTGANSVFIHAGASLVLEGVTNVGIATGGIVRFFVGTTGITSALSILPTVNSTYDLGSASFYWNNLYANSVVAVDVVTGGFSNAIKSTFNGSVVACPLPTILNALDVIKKIPDPTHVGDRGHYGNGLYFDDLTFPEEVLYEIDGTKEIEHTHMIGLLMQAVRELTSKVESLEEIINNL